MTARKAPPKDDYATISLGPKKIAVISRRMQSDRFGPIAMCTTDLHADLIVEALNVRKGEVEKLETPLKLQLDEQREAATKNSALMVQLREDISSLKRNLNGNENQLRNVSRDLATMTDKFNKADAEVRDLQAKIMRARELGQPV